MCANMLHVNCARRSVQASVGTVLRRRWMYKRLSARSRMRGAKRKPKQVHQCEHVVGEACCVGVVLFDPQVRLMIQQAVQHVGGIAHRGVDDLGVERCVLVGDVGVELHARLLAVFQVYLTGELPPPPVLKFWPSDDDVVPSPQYAAKGWRNCALTSIRPERSSRFRREYAMLATKSTWRRSYRGRIRPSY